MKRRSMVGTFGPLPVMARVEDVSEAAGGARLPAGPVQALSRESRLMSLLVEESSRACAHDVAQAQTAEDQLSTAYRNGPAHVIAQLIDAGMARWVKVFFLSFVRSLHIAEQHVGLELIRPEVALLAISHHVHGEASNVDAWEGTFRSLKSDALLA